MVSVDNEIKKAILPNGHSLVLWSYWNSKSGTDIYITEYDANDEEVKNHVSEWNVEMFEDGNFTEKDVLFYYNEVFNAILNNIARMEMDKKFKNKYISKGIVSPGQGWKGESHRHAMASRGIRSGRQ